MSVGTTVHLQSINTFFRAKVLLKHYYYFSTSVVKNQARLVYLSTRALSKRECNILQIVSKGTLFIDQTNITHHLH